LNPFAHLRSRLTIALVGVCYLNSEEGLSYVEPAQQVVRVETPTGAAVDGTAFDDTSLVVVSIIRAGDSMLDTFLRIVPSASVGKILIQRDEATAQPIMYYSKLPSLAGRNIILLDPMLATAGSAKIAIKSLLEKGAEEEKITFFNVISCPEGIAAMAAAYPKIRVVTGKIDSGLNEKVIEYDETNV
jgi:uracil phosphoribosyltransferase